MAATRKAARKDIITHKAEKLDTLDVASTTAHSDNQNNNNEGTFAKGPETVAVLMDNITDPHMLWQLVSASAAAKRAYDHRPISYLKVSMAYMPADLYQLALVYMDVASRELCKNSIPKESQDRPSIEKELMEVKDKVSIEQVMNKLFSGSNRNFPKHLSDPLASLQVVSEAYEAIDTLAYANRIWRVMPIFPCADGTPSLLPRIKRALWYLEIYSATFYRDYLVATSGIYETAYNFDKILPHIKLQEEFIHKLGFEEVDDMARVCDDLIHDLQVVYKAKLAKLFEEEYLSHVGPYNIFGREGNKEYASTSMGRLWYQNQDIENSLVWRARSEFEKMINYRMSLGVVYHAMIHKSRSRQVMTEDYRIPPDDYLKAMVRFRICGWHIPQTPIKDSQYRLHHFTEPAPPTSNDDSQASGDGLIPLAWKLEITLEPSLKHQRLTHMMIDVPILIGHDAKFTGRINMDPEGGPDAKRSADDNS